MNTSKPATRSAVTSPSNPAPNPAANPSSDTCLEADEESAAAQAEPMGSIAAAVPGDDAAAQDALDTREQPGAEAPKIRDQPQTPAGTEDHLQDESETA